MLEKLTIPDEQIKVLLQENYVFKVLTLDFLPLGNDANTWVYHVIVEGGTDYFLKVRPVPFYEASCIIPHWLRQSRLEGVVAPLLNKHNKLWTPLNQWAFMLYPFIKGDDGYKHGMNDEHWKELGGILKNIHATTLTPEIRASIRKETFTPKEGAWVSQFDAKLATLEAKNVFEQSFIASWLEQRPKICPIVSLLAKLAGLLRSNPKLAILCHADLHPGNVLLDSSNKVFLIDWDEVMLATKERDFLFVNEGNGELATVPFFQGYGEIEIDWIALTYYRCERVAQDLVAYAQRLFFEEGLQDASKAQAVQGLNVMFEPEGEVDAAFAAAHHLPSALTFDVSDK